MDISILLIIYYIELSPYPEDFDLFREVGDFTVFIFDSLAYPNPNVLVEFLFEPGATFLIYELLGFVKPINALDEFPTALSLVFDLFNLEEFDTPLFLEVFEVEDFLEATDFYEATDFVDF